MDRITEIHNSLIKHYAEKHYAEIAWCSESQALQACEVPEALYPLFQNYREAMLKMVKVSTESLLHAVAHVLAEQETYHPE